MGERERERARRGRGLAEEEEEKGGIQGREESKAIIHALDLIDTSFRMPRPDYLLEVNGPLQSNLFVERE